MKVAFEIYHHEDGVSSRVAQVCATYESAKVALAEEAANVLPGHEPMIRPLILREEGDDPQKIAAHQKFLRAVVAARDASDGVAAMEGLERRAIAAAYL